MNFNIKILNVYNVYILGQNETSNGSHFAVRNSTFSVLFMDDGTKVYGPLFGVVIWEYHM